MRAQKQVRRKVTRPSDRIAAQELARMFADLVHLEDVRVLKGIAEARLGRKKAQELLVKIVFG